MYFTIWKRFSKHKVNETFTTFRDDVSYVHTGYVIIRHMMFTRVFVRRQYEYLEQNLNHDMKLGDG